MSSPPVRRVFISHIHEEAELASVIQGWVTDAFQGHGVTAFVSSDTQSLPPGKKWIDVLQENLRGSEVSIAILSPESLRRPWLNIELGAAWIQGIAVIPFCHSGLPAGNNLPRPFGDFNGVDITSKNPGRDLLSGVADALKLSHPSRLDFAAFKSELVEASDHSLASKPTDESPPKQDALPEAQQTILIFLAKQMNALREDVEMSQVAHATSIKPASLKGHAQALYDLKLAYINYYSNGTQTLRLTAKGSAWLEANGLMP